MTDLKAASLKTIASLLLFASASAEVPAWALDAAPAASPQARILADPSLFEAPLDHSRLKEVHRGRGRLVIHIQDAHSNFSGQENLARTLDEIMNRYKVRLVMVEGGSRDDTLTPVKKIASQEIWKKVARSFLIDAKISGEEYLNLTSSHPMKINGIEDPALYRKSVRAYADLADAREKALDYLKRVRVSVEKIKNRLYPQELLDYENSKNSPEEEHARVLGLIAKYPLETASFPNLRRLADLKNAEARIDFVRANLEQAALFSELSRKGARVSEPAAQARAGKGRDASSFGHFQNILTAAEDKNISLNRFPELLRYRDYLKGFSEVDIDAVIDEMEKAEDRIYAVRLGADDARLLRAIDRYLALLSTAHSIQMTTKDFSFFKANESDYGTGACLAWINRKLTELGYSGELVPASDVLDEGKDALEAFYRSVSERDFAFVKNAEKVMVEENEKVAVLITGGYHTPHLKELFQKKGWAYAVLAPVVTGETNQKKYEEVLLEGVRGMDVSAAAKAPKRTEGVRPEAVREAPRLVDLATAAARLAGTNEEYVSRVLSEAIPSVDDAPALPDAVLRQQQAPVYADAIAAKIGKFIQSELTNRDVSRVVWALDKNEIPRDGNGNPVPFGDEDMLAVLRKTDEQLRSAGFGEDREGSMASSAYSPIGLFEALLSSGEGAEYARRNHYARWRVQNLRRLIADLPALFEAADIQGHELPIFLARDAMTGGEYLRYQSLIDGEPRPFGGAYHPGMNMDAIVSDFVPDPGLLRVQEATKQAAEEAKALAIQKYQVMTREQGRKRIPSKVHDPFYDEFHPDLYELTAYYYRRAIEKRWTRDADLLNEARLLYEQIKPEIGPDNKNVVLIDLAATGKTLLYVKSVIEHFSQENNDPVRVRVFVGWSHDKKLFIPEVRMYANELKARDVRFTEHGKPFRDQEWAFRRVSQNKQTGETVFGFTPNNRRSHILIQAYRSMMLYNAALERSRAAASSAAARLASAIRPLSAQAVDWEWAGTLGKILKPADFPFALTASDMAAILPPIPIRKISVKHVLNGDRSVSVLVRLEPDEAPFFDIDLTVRPSALDSGLYILELNKSKYDEQAIRKRLVAADVPDSQAFLISRKEAWFGDRLFPWVVRSKALGGIAVPKMLSESSKDFFRGLGFYQDAGIETMIYGRAQDPPRFLIHKEKIQAQIYRNRKGALDRLKDERGTVMAGARLAVDLLKLDLPRSSPEFRSLIQAAANIFRDLGKPFATGGMLTNGVPDASKANIRLVLGSQDLKLFQTLAEQFRDSESEAPIIISGGRGRGTPGLEAMLKTVLPQLPDSKNLEEALKVENISEAELIAALFKDMGVGAGAIRSISTTLEKKSKSTYQNLEFVLNLLKAQPQIVPNSEKPRIVIYVTEAQTARTVGAMIFRLQKEGLDWDFMVTPAYQLDLVSMADPALLDFLYKVLGLPEKFAEEFEFTDSDYAASNRDKDEASRIVRDSRDNGSYPQNAVATDKDPNHPGGRYSFKGGTIAYDHGPAEIKQVRDTLFLALLKKAGARLADYSSVPEAQGRPDPEPRIRRALADGDLDLWKKELRLSRASELDHFIFRTTLDRIVLDEPRLLTTVRELDRRLLESEEADYWNPAVNALELSYVRGNSPVPVGVGYAGEGAGRVFFHYSMMGYSQKFTIDTESSFAPEEVNRALLRILSGRQSPRFLTDTLKLVAGRTVSRKQIDGPITVSKIQEGRYQAVYLVLVRLRDAEKTLLPFILMFSKKGGEKSWVVEKEYRNLRDRQGDPNLIQVLLGGRADVASGTGTPSSEKAFFYSSRFNDHHGEVILRMDNGLPMQLHLNSSLMTRALNFEEGRAREVLAGMIGTFISFYDERLGVMPDRFMIAAGDINVDERSVRELAGEYPRDQRISQPRFKMIAWRGNRTGVGSRDFLRYLFEMDYLSRHLSGFSVRELSTGALVYEMEDHLIPNWVTDAVLVGLAEGLVKRHGPITGLIKARAWLNRYVRDMRSDPSLRTRQLLLTRDAENDLVRSGDDIEIFSEERIREFVENGINKTIERLRRKRSSGARLAFDLDSELKRLGDRDADTRKTAADGMAQQDLSPEEFDRLIGNLGKPAMPDDSSGLDPVLARKNARIATIYAVHQVFLQRPFNDPLRLRLRDRLEREAAASGSDVVTADLGHSEDYSVFQNLRVAANALAERHAPQWLLSSLQMLSPVDDTPLSARIYAPLVGSFLKPGALDGARLSRTADWDEGYAEAMKDRGKEQGFLKTRFDEAQKQYALTTFVESALRQFWEGKRDGYAALLKDLERNEAAGARLSMDSDARAEESRAKIWKQITSSPIETKPANREAAVKAVEAFKAYVDASGIDFNQKNWAALDYEAARRASVTLPEGNLVEITFIPYIPDAKRPIQDGMAVIELAGDLVGHAFYNYDQPAVETRTSDSVRPSAVRERRGTVYPAFGIHPDHQGKVSSGRIYEIYLKTLDALFSPEFFKVDITQVINSQPGDNEERTIFYLKRGYRPPNFVYSNLFGFADEMYLKLQAGERLERGALRKLVDIMYSRGYPGAFWSSPWLGEEEADGARLAGSAADTQSSAASKTLKQDGDALSVAFGKPAGRKLSSAGAVSGSLGNRQRLLALSAQDTEDLYFGFREGGREAWTGLVFENAAGGEKDAVFYFWDREEGARHEFGRIRLTARDIERGRALLKRRASLRDARLQAQTILKSQALQFIKEDGQDELAARRLADGLRKGGVAVASRPVVYLVDAASMHDDTALQFSSMIAQRKKGNPSYANTYFIFLGSPVLPGLVSDDLSSVLNPESMKLAYYGSPAGITAGQLEAAAKPIAERFKLEDRRIGFVPIEPVSDLGPGDAPHYRVAGIVLTHALLQRIELRPENIGVLRGGFKTQLENALGRDIAEDLFTISALRALQEFDESHGSAVYIAFAARAKKVDFELIAEYAALKRQLDIAA